MFSLDCTCEQKRHSAPIKSLTVEAGAIERVAELLGEYRRIYLVCDGNTYEVAGRRVEALLRAAGSLSHVTVLEAGAHPTNANVGRVLIEAGAAPEPYDIGAFSQNPDFILAVGSGSVNDICRMVSYRLGIEYGVVGTAPSMDGYISVVAPLIVGNRKIVYSCTVARHIIIDLAVAAMAPREMLLAGIGDMIGKYVAMLDWELSRRLTGEYYCERVAEMVLDATDKCIASAEALLNRDLEAVRCTVDGLLLSGLGIAYTGSSRPASGTEHMIGQTFEVMDVEEGKSPNLHGIEVGEATFAAILIFRRLYRETKEAWLRELIEKYLPAFDRILALQETLRLPFTVTDRERFIEGVLRGRTFRVRYTVLQYLYDRGELADYASYAYDETMKYKAE